MKNIWIYNSLDGPIYFSNPRKAYNYAKLEDEVSYPVYLKNLREDYSYPFKRDDELSIVKINVL
ncbi:hypothetical protein HDF24_04460 [Mucilaginibacter sp. X4EP1]|uniref:hypothetical protein n=1 Tax=Mucilaginibacter sp. X4EP1 TaxID=2723092 RepID=UPI00216969D1|nr:hypothetical protein [Mucilaginibacter sp. X4EP1]MCS3816240.1 hypothetical protein [Mucilaginibacter sp. X4EP1]